MRDEDCGIAQQQITRAVNSNVGCIVQVGRTAATAQIFAIRFADI